MDTAITAPSRVTSFRLAPSSTSTSSSCSAVSMIGRGPAPSSGPTVPSRSTRTTRAGVAVPRISRRRPTRSVAVDHADDVGGGVDVDHGPSDAPCAYGAKDSVERDAFQVGVGLVEPWSDDLVVARRDGGDAGRVRTDTRLVAEPRGTGGRRDASEPSERSSATLLIWTSRSKVPPLCIRAPLIGSRSRSSMERVRAEYRTTDMAYSAREPAGDPVAVRLQLMPRYSGVR